MLDLELPIKKLHIIKRLFLFKKNKKLIYDFIKNYKGKIDTAEYFWTKNNFLSPNLRNKKIKMLYSSFHSFSEKFMRKTAKGAIIGLGIIAQGIDRRDLILSPKKLRSELQLLKDQKEVIIFRLGGLNKRYLNAIQESTP